MELNDRQWNIFEMEKLFEPKRGNHIGLKKNLMRGTKVISATTKNNGFACFTNNQSEYDGNVFTIANTGQGSVGVVFYQDEPFISTNNITVLIPKFNLNRNIAMFLLPLFKKERYRLSFGRILNESRLKKHTIKLPVNSNNNPDWDFMENYVMNMINKIEIKTTITEKPFHKHKLKLTDRHWKYFRYDDSLFEIKKGKRVIIKEIMDQHGEYNFVSAIKHNNGVSCKTNLKPNQSSNVITVNYDGNGGVGEAFYQDEPFWALDSVNVLYPKFELNSFIAMFLVTLIRKERYRFSFGRKWDKEKMEKSIIKLPVDDNGKPDWDFMEKYIKSLSYSSNLK